MDKSLSNSPLIPVSAPPGEQIGRLWGLYMTLFLLSLATFVIAPVLALTWSGLPFPGLLVEQTLVVSDVNGRLWSGRSAGIGHPQRITHIDGQPVQTSAEYNAALRAYAVGDRVEIRTVLPDGREQVYQDVEMMSLPLRDMGRLFWLPYVVGLVYLGIAAWVYRYRSQTLAGRAFVFFCLTTSIVLSLLFDLTTTHATTEVWTLAVAQQGGALISLAFLFPAVSSPVRRYPWARFSPYLVSLAIALWGLLVIHDYDHPWAYIPAWRASYYYTSLGILVFLVAMIYRLRTHPAPVIRQQARIILLGGFLAFVPLVIWFSAPLTHMVVRWNPGIFMPFLLVFPLTISVAILRYRLWDIDVIINRTLVYLVLTTVLAVLYFASIYAFQNILMAVVTTSSHIDAFLSALLIVALFNPLRTRIQRWIDKRFYRSKYDMAKTLAEVSVALRDEVDINQLTERLQAVVDQTLQPTHSTLLTTSQISVGDAVVTYFSEYPDAVQVKRLHFESSLLEDLGAAGIQIIAPLVSQGEVVGLLNLGARRSEQEYSRDDLQLLSTLASQVAPAVRVAQLVQQQQAELLERERMEQEMRVARLIQQTLLPKEPPTLPGWKLAVHYQPARAVGGDFYDFFVMDDGRVVLLVGDVTDKGVPAALLMATTRSILRGTARQMMPPGEALSHSNDILHPETPPGMFVTCLYAILDPATGQLQYANAGHPPPYAHNDGVVSELYARGMPLGLMPGMEYEEKEAMIQAGGCLLLYSDGLIEAHNGQDEMFGIPRLCAWMQNQSHNGEPMLNSLLDELHSFAGENWEQEDDVTLLTLQRLVTP